ncbi:hypothetical protein [Aeromonas sp. WP2-W18-CRE-05]|uniref:hypothetical protein n=1 Tax=Aeromonas sp. WP2-W18-CRE-05 TaxID=2675707 RepID=UPI0015DCA69B|nr:hypothetical protein [Aeromonas sp. WP2-W18-CRE-05]BBQ26452.1 hypothetical protein WP2W18C05_26680 [Aeromonas sp. WP2-W18-CRE-05]
MMEILKHLLDLLVQRFITEDVALELLEDGCHPVCSMEDVRPGEEFDGIVAMRSFTWLNVASFPRIVGEVRPWAAR